MTSYLTMKGYFAFVEGFCVLRDGELHQVILNEAHNSPYSMHSDSNKMHHDLYELYWWPSLKRAITEFVAKYLIFQKVKAEYQFPSGLLQPFKIP